MYTENDQVTPVLDDILSSLHSIMNSLESLRGIINASRDNEVLFTSNHDPEIRTLHDVNKLIRQGEISARTGNCIRHAGFHNLEDLEYVTTDDLHTVRNLGKRTLKELQDSCLSFNIQIGNKVPDQDVYQLHEVVVYVDQDTMCGSRFECDPSRLHTGDLVRIREIYPAESHKGSWFHPTYFKCTPVNSSDSQHIIKLTESQVAKLTSTRRLI